MTYQSAVVERRIAAPVDTVWRLLTEPERAADATVRRLTAGPFGAGTRWRETRRAGGRSLTCELAVTHCTPGVRYVVDSVAAGRNYTLEYALLSYVCEGDTEPVETEEGTLVRVAVHTSTRRRMGRLLTHVRSPGAPAAVRRAVAADLAAVAAACEQGREPAV